MVNNQEGNEASIENTKPPSLTNLTEMTKTSNPGKGAIPSCIRLNKCISVGKAYHPNKAEQCIHPYIASPSCFEKGKQAKSIGPGTAQESKGTLSWWCHRCTDKRKPEINKMSNP